WSAKINQNQGRVIPVELLQHRFWQVLPCCRVWCSLRHPGLRTDVRRLAPLLLRSIQSLCRALRSGMDSRLAEPDTELVAGALREGCACGASRLDRGGLERHI
ncbi:hypothetical protein Vretimale_19603, partial [Volvox reticuliferus]